MESWKPKPKPFPRNIVAAFRHHVNRVCDIDIGITSSMLESMVKVTQTAVGSIVSQD